MKLSAVDADNTSLHMIRVFLQDSKLKAVVSTIQMMAGVVNSYITTSRSSVSPDAIHTISALYQEKAKGSLGTKKSKNVAAVIQSSEFLSNPSEWKCVTLLTSKKLSSWQKSLQGRYLVQEHESKICRLWIGLKNILLSLCVLALAGQKY